MYILKAPSAAASKITVSNTASTVFDLIAASFVAGGGSGLGYNAGYAVDANGINLIVEDGDIRYLLDDNIPTATVGILVKSGSRLFLRGIPVKKMRLIRVAGSNVNCSVEIGRCEKGESSSADNSVGGSGSSSSSASSIGGGNSTYSNVQGDFTATANSGAKTITLSAYASTVLSASITVKNFANAVIKRTTSAGVVDTLPLTNIAFAANVLTLADMPANFAAGDIVSVFVPGNDKAFDETNDAQKVGGNIASGSADAGSPVKIAGVYNSSAPTFANGQRGDMQIDSAGNHLVSLGTKIAGEDQTNDVMKMQAQFTPTNITTQTTTVLKASAGQCGGISINTPVANAVITIYDNTSAAGTKIATITLPATLLSSGPIFWSPGVAGKFATGLTVVTSGATMDITAYWN